MRNTIIIMICLVGLAGSPAMGQADELTNRDELAALAAKTEAMGSLLATLAAEPLGSDATVLEAIGGEQLPLSLVTQIAGAVEFRPVAVQQGGAGMVAVQAAVPTDEFLWLLEQYCTQEGNDAALEAIALQAARYVDVDELTATGFGQVRGGGRMLLVTGDASVDSSDYLRGTPHAYWQAHCTEQGRVRTVLAARDDALRALARSLRTVPVPEATGDETLGSLVGERFVELAMGSFLNGAQATGIRYATDDLQIDVRVEASLQDVVLAVKGYMSNQETPVPEAVALLEQWVVTMTDEPREAQGSARVATEFRTDGGDVLFFLGQLIGDFGLAGEALTASGTAAVDDSIDDIAAARRQGYVDAAYAARDQLAVTVAKLPLDDDDELTLGDLMAADVSVRRVVQTWLTLADVTPGSGDIGADNIATLTLDLPIAPLADLVRGESIGRVERDEEPETPSEAPTVEPEALDESAPAE